MAITKNRKIIVSSCYEMPSQKMWEKLQDVETLIEICKPYARFTPVAGPMPTRWKENTKYTFMFFAYGFIPFGRHFIFIERIDPAVLEIQSREYNKFVKVWDHFIKLEPLSDNRVRYTDEIVVYAGIFTRFVAFWSKAFYKHRQSKWQKIAKNL